MGARTAFLLDTIEVFKRTGVYLLGYENGYTPIGYGDDLGLYYFIPKLMTLFHWDMDQTVVFFLAGLITISSLIGLISCFLMAKKATSRLLILPAYVLMVVVIFTSWDVYVVQAATVLTIIPPYLYISSKKYRPGIFIPFLLLAGLFLGYANFVRTQSGTLVLIFLALAIGLYLKIENKKKLVLFACLLVGVVFSKLHVSSLLAKRDAFLQEHAPHAPVYVSRHAYWHSIYISMGYLNNPYGLIPRDRYAHEFVAKISPTTIPGSAEYESILRRGTFKFWIEHPFFSVQTFFAKFGVYLFYFFLFGHWGGVLWLKKRSYRECPLAFYGALALSGLIGLLTVPFFAYALGFIALSTLMGSIALIRANDRGQLVKFPSDETT